MILAAGILFVAPGDQALYLLRGPGSDYPLHWCFPGGTTEEGETASETAERETIEELGFLPEGQKALWTTAISAAQTGSRATAPLPPESANGAVAPALPPATAILAPEVEFTTFFQRVPAVFEPKLNGEHVGFCWAPLEKPPEPLHPGCRIALDRATMDELGIARAIARGSLASPQRYMNVSLFAVRITGTGVSYRAAKNEFVYRRATDYLTDDFLARCAGLSVIMKHPKTALLDSKEFADRIVGSMLLPYIKGDEVWGVAKIYDDDAVSLMLTTQLSTSPGVILSGRDTKVVLEDGSTLLIEGKPDLLDHLAICEHGVWDKGEGPTGVDSGIRGDSSMTEEEKAALAKKDADEGTKLDKLLAGLDAMTAKMDSMSTRMDSFEMADKAKKDAEEEEEAKKKADAEEAEREKGDPARLAADKAKKDEEDEKTRKDASEALRLGRDAATGVGDIKTMIADVAKKLPLALTDEDFAAMANAQARADDVFHAFGGRAPRPLDGEDLVSYRRRLAAKLQAHSPTWKSFDLARVAADSASFSIAEDQIYAHAIAAAANPTDIPQGTLRAVTRTTESGHRETTFQGEPRAWMSNFAPNIAVCTSIAAPTKH